MSGIALVKEDAAITSKIRFVSCSKDASLQIWETGFIENVSTLDGDGNKTIQHTLSGHHESVTCLYFCYQYGSIQLNE